MIKKILVGGVLLWAGWLSDSVVQTKVTVGKLATLVEQHMKITSASKAPASISQADQKQLKRCKTRAEASQCRVEHIRAESNQAAHSIEGT